MKNLMTPLFLLGLAARLVAMPLFGSYFLTELFIPFVDHGILSPFSNPWAELPPIHFPYGSALYVFLFIPKALAYLISPEAALGIGPLSLAAMKTPLLMFDLLLLFILSRRVPGRERDLIVLYWLNPVLFYITYIHGQLDVASMAFSILSLDLLARRRIILSAAAMAIAIHCKFHVILVVPFAMAFLWNRNFLVMALKKVGTWCGVFGTLAAVGFLPQLAAGRLGYVSVGSPEAMRLFAAQIDLGGGHTLYLGVAAVLIVLGRLCVSSRISESGLFSGAAVLFATLLLAVDPMPGWYYWIFPLFAMVFTSRSAAPRVLFWASAAGYFAYFVVSTHLPEEIARLGTGIALATLQACIAGMALVTWSLEVRTEAPIERRVRPLLIGISGDSGAGKTTLASILADLFDSKMVSIVSGDDYHRWERDDPIWRETTHLAPGANDLLTLTEHSRELKGGLPIRHHRYDHGSGRFTAPREVRPGRVVIIEGLHALYSRGLRALYDLRIYLEPDEDVRIAWKVRRDVSERGHSAASAMEMIEVRSAAAREHVKPQRPYADWVIEMKPDGPLDREAALDGKLPPLYARHVLWNDAPIERLVSALETSGECKAQVSPVEGDIDRVGLIVRGHLSAKTAERIAASLFPELRQITRGWRPPKFHEGHAGVAQLITLLLLAPGKRQ